MGGVGRVQCGVRVPCCPLWGVFVPSLGRLGCRDLGPGRCVLDREAGQPAGGAGQRQDKGLVVPSEKTQTWVSLRLKLPVPLPGSHKGNFVWLRREEAPRRSGNGRAASESQLTAEITPVTPNLADRAATRPDGHVWDKSVLCASGPALSDPGQTRCFLENRVGGATSAPLRTGFPERAPVQVGGCLRPALWVQEAPHAGGSLGCAGVNLATLKNEGPRGQTLGRGAAGQPGESPDQVRDRQVDTCYPFRKLA